MKPGNEVTISLPGVSDARYVATMYRERGNSWLADLVESQIPEPAIEEPTEFGSMVRARSDKLFVLADVTGDDDMRWCGQNGLWCRFANLDVVEAVRVGIGERHYTEEEIDDQQAEAQRIIHNLNTVAAGKIAPPDPQEAEALARALPAPESADDLRPKVRNLLGRLAELHRAAITAPEQRCYETAHNMVAALLEDS